VRELWGEKNLGDWADRCWLRGWAAVGVSFGCEGCVGGWIVCKVCCRVDHDGCSVAERAEGSG